MRRYASGRWTDIFRTIRFACQTSTNTGSHTSPTISDKKPIDGTRIAFFAIACGLAVGNLYYAQPLLETIGAAYGVGEGPAGLIVTTTQIGYALGLLAIVPLGDLVENRRLVLSILCGTVLVLVAAASAPNFPTFVAASLAIGITSVAAQVLVPLAANLAPEATRGRVVGQVMSGLITGILLSRALAGVIAGAAGWRSVYALSAVLMAATIVVLGRIVPRRSPTFAGDYRALMRSLVTIFRREPVLRRRAAYQALMFASFSAFWTSVTFHLSASPYRFTQTEIGFFALAGALGALVAPVAGRLGDAGHGRRASLVAFVLAAAGFALTAAPGIAPLVCGAIALDVGVQMSLVLGQQAIYALAPAERGRLNTLYVALFFLGGAAGSAAASGLFAYGAWPLVVIFGCALPLVACALWSTESVETTLPA